MPDWRKLVTSGSSAELYDLLIDQRLRNRGSVTGSHVTGSFTGSFTGDATYITKYPVSFLVELSDEVTTLVTKTGANSFRAPYAFTVSDLRASVNTAPTGSSLIVDINENGTSILSTRLSIDADEKTSTTAATAYVLSDSTIADDSEISFDIDQVGSTFGGRGLKVRVYGYKT